MLLGDVVETKTIRMERRISTKTAETMATFLATRPPGVRVDVKRLDMMIQSRHIKHHPKLPKNA